jgi:hypothetical protein
MLMGSQAGQAAADHAVVRPAVVHPIVDRLAVVGAEACLKADQEVTAPKVD